jgi:AraC-like DNA-binding protein
VLTGFAESAIDGLAGSWERRIRDEIRGHPRRSPTLRDVSSRLAMSDRTLQLRLQEAGTTFSAIVDDERRLFVEALLLVPTFAVADVARRAGFSTTEGLSRAMVRWTGRSPVAWRRERS